MTSFVLLYDYFRSPPVATLWPYSDRSEFPIRSPGCSYVIWVFGRFCSAWRQLDIFFPDFDRIWIMLHRNSTKMPGWVTLFIGFATHGSAKLGLSKSRSFCDVLFAKYVSLSQKILKNTQMPKCTSSLLKNMIGAEKVMMSSIVIHQMLEHAFHPCRRFRRARLAGELGGQENYVSQTRTIQVGRRWSSSDIVRLRMIRLEIVWHLWTLMKLFRVCILLRDFSTIIWVRIW